MIKPREICLGGISRRIWLHELGPDWAVRRPVRGLCLHLPGPGHLRWPGDWEDRVAWLCVWLHWLARAHTCSLWNWEEIEIHFASYKYDISYHLHWKTLCLESWSKCSLWDGGCQSHEAAAQNYANSQYISKHGPDIYCWMNFITALWRASCVIGGKWSE